MAVALADPGPETSAADLKSAPGPVAAIASGPIEGAEVAISDIAESARRPLITDTTSVLGNDSIAVEVDTGAFRDAIVEADGTVVGGGRIVEDSGNAVLQASAGVPPGNDYARIYTDWRVGLSPTWLETLRFGLPHPEMSAMAGLTARLLGGRLRTVPAE